MRDWGCVLGGRGEEGQGKKPIDSSRGWREGRGSLGLAHSLEPSWDQRGSRDLGTPIGANRSGLSLPIRTQGLGLRTF